MNEISINEITREELLCIQKRKEFTNIILNDELKELAFKEMITAQDINSPFYLNKLTSYEIYHDRLKEHFNKFYGKNPNQTDNLAFILLLTYPKANVERFKNFSDLKLAFNNVREESDFESLGFVVHDGFGEANCICNEDIMNVHIFRNIYSGINIQLGSVCNKRYGLISRNDPNYKSDCKKIKEFKEREKEIRENLPEGYYANERKRIKEEKLKEKEEKMRKKEFDKLNKKEPGCFKINNCILCNKEGIYKTIDISICSLCISTNIKSKKQNLNNSIKGNSAYKDCISCEIEFVSINNQLCDNCNKMWCLEKCKMCPENFLKHNDINDLYCLDCDSKISNCIDCKRDILKPSIRCHKCEYKFVNNLHSFICDYCKKEEYVSQKDIWKTKMKTKNCKDCYRDLVKESNCIICDNIFKKMPDETWKTKCRDCY